MKDISGLGACLTALLVGLLSSASAAGYTPPYADDLLVSPPLYSSINHHDSRVFRTKSLSSSPDLRHVISHQLSKAKEANPYALPPAFPTISAAQPAIERCWGEQAVFTVTTSYALPAGAQFEWYTKDASGNPQYLARNTNPVFTTAMPGNAISGAAVTYYVDIVDASNNRSLEKPLSCQWYLVDAALGVDANYSGTAPYLQGYKVQCTAQANNSLYVWDWGDGSSTSTSGNTATHAYAQAGTYKVTVVITKNFIYSSGSCSGSGTLLGLVVITPLCEMQMLSGGQIQQNTRSGAISYVPANACLPVNSFECLSESSVTVPDVVAATATAFTDQLAATPPPGTAPPNPYLAGQWRTTPVGSYSFRTGLTLNSTNYSAGTFTLRPFDWESSIRARPTVWLTATITEQVSAHGNVLQERDPLGIPSAAKFGYGVTAAGTSAQILPYLQAQNAESSAVLFESFENTYTLAGLTSGEDGLPFGKDVQVIDCSVPNRDCFPYAHTGNACALLTNRQMQLLPIPLTTQLNASGLLVKVWVRPQVQDTSISPLRGTVDLLYSRTGNSVVSVPFTSVAQVGEWILLEAKIPMNTSGANLGETLVPLMRFSRSGSGESSGIWIDDVRVQPAEAQLTAYVYDPVSLRLVASFDDQHFALRYQYNVEGKLIRKQAETERGLKTLQETHYHTPSTNQVND